MPAPRLEELGFAFLTTLDRVELSSKGTDGAATSWVQVGVVGEFVNAQYGPIDITPADLQRMLSNFKNEYPQSPYQLPFDYDHLSTRKDRKPGDGVAAGWFLDMELRRDGRELWALIEWTAPAADKIRKKEYRYCSPTFYREWATNAGKAIGTTMVAAALTNYPFLTMTAITLANEPALVSGLYALPKTKRVNRMDTIKVRDKDGNEVEVDVSGISLDALSQIPAFKDLQAKTPKADDLKAMNDKIIAMSTDVDTLKTQLVDADKRAIKAENDLRGTRLTALKRSGRIDGADETYGKGLIAMENGAALFDSWATAMQARTPRIELAREHGAGGAGDTTTKTQSAEFVELVEKHERENKTSRRDAIRAIQLARPELARAYREDVPDYRTAKPIGHVLEPVAR